MGRNRKTYSETFKRKVAVEALEGKKSGAEIASEYGIAPALVSEWKKAFLDGTLASKETAKLQKNYEELKVQLEQAQLALGKRDLELEIIKKKFPTLV